jgi:hypothetical protein
MKAIFNSTLMVLLSVTAFAQHNLGIATSNWSCMNSLNLNPANIAESREKKAVNLFSFSMGVDNNVGPLNAGQGLFVAVGDGKSNNMFTYTNNSKVSMHAPQVDITGPGVLLKVDDKHTIAFTTRIRGMNQFNNFDQTLFHTFNDPKFRTTENILASTTDFTYTVHLWSEIGFTYGGVFFDNGIHKIKAGGTVRYLGGIAYVGVDGNTLDANFTAGKDTFYAGNTDIRYSSNILNTKSSAGSNISSGFFSLLYKGKFGHGIGADLGVVYEYKPTEEVLEKNVPEEDRKKAARSKLKKTKKEVGYRARFSLALCDVGTVHYNKNKNATEYITGGGYVTGAGILNKVKNLDDLKQYATKRGLAAEIRQEAVALYMPMHMVVGGDYHIQKHYYANVTLMVNLADRNRLGNSYYNQLTVTPRYETKKVTVGLPLTYSTLSHRFKAGLGVLAGGFFVGSDDMLAFMLKSEYGISFYAGLNVPIYK